MSCWNVIKTMITELCDVKIVKRCKNDEKIVVVFFCLWWASWVLRIAPSCLGCLLWFTRLTNSCLLSISSVRFNATCVSCIELLLVSLSPSALGKLLQTTFNWKKHTNNFICHIIDAMLKTSPKENSLLHVNNNMGNWTLERKLGENNAVTPRNL